MCILLATISSSWEEIWSCCNEISQEKRLAEEIADLEKDTGFKLRILAQNYPDTPGSQSFLSLFFFFWILRFQKFFVNLSGRLNFMLFSQDWQLRIIGNWMIEQLFLLLILLLVEKFPYLNPLDIASAGTFYNYLFWLIGNILNFNVGAQVDLDIPRSFWSRLAGKYGNIFYWKEKVKVHSQSDTSFVFDSLWNLTSEAGTFAVL